MTIFALIGMLIIGVVISVVGGHSYHNQKKKEKIAGSDINSRASAIGAAHLMSFGGILIILGISYLFKVL